MVEVAGDLLGAAAGGEMLGAVQRRAPSSAERFSRSSATSGTARRAHFSHGASAAESTTTWRTTRQPA